MLLHGAAVRWSKVWLHCCIVAALSWLPQAAAQEIAFNWARNMGGLGDDRGFGIAVDSSGNTYTAGSFSDIAVFDGAELEGLSAGAADIFVTKHDAAGGIQWVRTMGGPGNDQAMGIGVDASGDVYITGQFADTVDFDPGPGTSPLTSAGTDDIFILKLDTDGFFAWAHRFGGLGISRGLAIAVDAAGHSHTTGFFSGPVDFDPGPGEAIPPNIQNFEVFVLKLDADGTFVWVRSTSSASADEGQAIALDASGNVYTTGYFTNTTNFDPGISDFSLPNLGGEDIFVCKHASNGDFQWARAFGGVDATERGQGIAVDSAGGVYFTGRFSGSGDFDPGAGTFMLDSLGATNAFLCKVSDLGGFEWARAIGSDLFTQAWAVAMDGSGNPVITGEFTGVIELGPSMNSSERDAAGIFLASFDSDGNPLGGQEIGDADGARNCSGRALAADDDGSLSLTGHYAGTVDFDPGPGTDVLVIADLPNIFVARFSSEIVLVPSIEGRVTAQATGAPIPCAVVALEQIGGPLRVVGATDTNGYYFVETVPPGEYRVRVIAPGFEQPFGELADVVEGVTETRDFALFPSSFISFLDGIATDAEGGWPCIGVLVELFIDDEFVDDTFTCADGRFQFPLLGLKQIDPIDVRLRFSLENYTPAEVEETVDRALGATIDGELSKSVVPTAALAGSVRGLVPPATIGLGNARVSLRGPINGSIQTDEAGLFAIDGILDGAYTITASAPGFEGQTRQSPIAPGSVGEANFELVRLGIPGDINNDGVVNAVDVQLVINAALGIAIDPGLNADINGDAQVNAVDVQLAINAALGLAIG